jgi:hypothetical protein
MEQLLVRARRLAATRPRGAEDGARDTVTVRIFEASDRRVASFTFRWVGNDSASATVPGEARDVGFYAPSGLLVRVHYPAPAGMRIVRADARR